MTVGRGRGNLTIIWGGRAKGVKNDCWALGREGGI